MALISIYRFLLKMTPSVGVPLVTNAPPAMPIESFETPKFIGSLQTNI